MHTSVSPSILKRDVRGRVTTPAARREALLDEFERSGLKGLPFARLAGLNYQTFAGWIQKRRRQREGHSQIPVPIASVPALVPDTAGDRGASAIAPQPIVSVEEPALRVAKQSPMPRFLEVAVSTRNVDAVKSETSSHSELKLVLPGGATLAIQSSQQVALAAELLNALRPVC